MKWLAKSLENLATGSKTQLYQFVIASVITRHLLNKRFYFYVLTLQSNFLINFYMKRKQSQPASINALWSIFDNT